MSYFYFYFFFFNDTATTEIYTLSLHDALPILQGCRRVGVAGEGCRPKGRRYNGMVGWACWGKVHRLKSVLRGADSAAAIWGSLTWVWAQTTIACACLPGIPDE